MPNPLLLQLLANQAAGNKEFLKRTIMPLKRPSKSLMKTEVEPLILKKSTKLLKNSALAELILSSWVLSMV